MGYFYQFPFFSITSSLIFFMSVMSNIAFLFNLSSSLDFYLLSFISIPTLPSAPVANPPNPHPYHQKTAPCLICTHNAPSLSPL